MYFARIRESERITIFGDYDCDGVLGAHILRSVLTGLGAAAENLSASSG